MLCGHRLSSATPCTSAATSRLHGPPVRRPESTRLLALTSWRTTSPLVCWSTPSPRHSMVRSTALPRRLMARACMPLVTSPTSMAPTATAPWPSTPQTGLLSAPSRLDSTRGSSRSWRPMTRSTSAVSSPPLAVTLGPVSQQCAPLTVRYLTGMQAQPEAATRSQPSRSRPISPSLWLAATSRP